MSVGWESWWESRMYTHSSMYHQHPSWVKKIQSLSRWSWDRWCPLSDHWLIITNNNQLYSLWCPALYKSCCGSGPLHPTLLMSIMLYFYPLFTLKTFWKVNYNTTRKSCLSEREELVIGYVSVSIFFRLKIYCIMLLVSSTNLIWYVWGQEESRMDRMLR